MVSPSWVGEPVSLITMQTRKRWWWPFKRERLLRSPRVDPDSGVMVFQVPAKTYVTGVKIGRYYRADVRIEYFDQAGMYTITDISYE